jgi:hypothetical protein
VNELVEADVASFEFLRLLLARCGTVFRRFAEATFSAAVVAESTIVAVFVVFTKAAIVAEAAVVAIVVEASVVIATTLIAGRCLRAAV